MILFGFFLSHPANIDMATDDKIQDVVREAFVEQGITLMTIAHRLNTIIDYDRILVMDSGSVAEFGRGETLLGNPQSQLSQLVDSLGQNAAAQLRIKATQARLPTFLDLLEG
jgi:ATP-binding cassette subfamily C (CFTR/MRP) protein 4